MSNNIEAIYEVIDNNFDDYVAQIRNFLKVPNFSSTGEGIKENAEMVLDHLKELGADVKLDRIENGHPLVFGTINSKNPNAKTILLYSFYDGFKTNFEEWTFSPYEAKIVDAEKINLSEKLGKVIVAQSAFNTKAPLLAFILTLKAIKESTGDLPVNFIYAIEGEEQIGSPNMVPFLKKYENIFKQANTVYLPGMRQDELGNVTISLGTKGIVRFELVLKSGKWGGTLDGKDLQAPHFRLVDAPFWRIVQALNTMIGPDDKIIIDDFFKNVRPPTPEEKKLLDEMKDNLDEESLRKSLNISKFKRDLPAKELIEDYIMAPLFHVESITPTSRGGLPMNVKAGGHMRIVPNQSPEGVISTLRKHLDRNGFPEIEIKTFDGSDWARTQVSTDIVQAILKSLDEFNINYSVRPTSIFGSGYFVFNRPPLNLPVGSTGLGHGERAHRIDEYVTVKGIKDNMKFVASFLNKYA